MTMAQAKTIVSVPCVDFRMTIKNISKLDKVWSPEYLVHGIPWKISVSKVNQKIAVFLHCAKQDKQTDWSAAAFVTLSLVPFIGDIHRFKHHIAPYVFDHNRLGFGTTSIGCEDLFSPQKNYVKNDTINLDVNIVAADPNVENASNLIFETIKQSCDESCVSIFRLVVTNIENLIAVHSPLFKIRQLFWTLTVYKDNSANLSIRLQHRSQAGNFSCKMLLSVKLISLDKKIEPIEPDAEFANLRYLNCASINDIISWDELLKPENGFVKRKAIVLEVEIKSDKPVDANGKTNDSKIKSDQQKMECSICIESIGDQELSSTPCGHLYCSTCIEDSVKERELCPLCDTTVIFDDLRRIYLPL